jgi:UDP-glucose 4-epimerase
VTSDARLRVAVVGAAGFIGSNVTDELRRRGHDVLAIGRRDRDVDVVDDLSDPVRLSDVLRDRRIDAVCHCAWNGHPRSSGHQYVEQFEANLRTSSTVAVAVGTSRVMHLMFMSTGGGASVPATSGALPPAYGWAKACAEAVLSASAEAFGYRYTCLRPTAVYGPGQDPATKLGAVAVFAQRLLEGQPLEILGSMEAGRDFLHVLDLAELTAECVEQRVVGTFEVGGPEFVSLASLIAALERASGRRAAVNLLPTTGLDPVRVQLDNGPVTVATGWRPRRRLADELGQILADLGRRANQSVPAPSQHR